MFKRVLSLSGLVLGCGLLYLFASGAWVGAWREPLLAPLQRPVLALLPLAGALLLLYLHAACGLFGAAPIRLFNWLCLALSVAAALSWIALLYVWQRGDLAAWVLPVYVVGAGEALAGLLCLLWAWLQEQRSARLLVPASLCQALALGLFGTSLALGLGG